MNFVSAYRGIGVSESRQRKHITLLEVLPRYTVTPLLRYSLLLLLAVPAAQAATITATSPSYEDVAAAVATASPGDTVIVPKGRGAATWINTLRLTRGIHLQGPGRDKLTITRGDAIIDIHPSPTALANHELFKVSGFTFDLNMATMTNSAAIYVYGPTTAPILKHLIILNNRIQNDGSVPGSGTFAIKVKGQVRGVIAKNDFDRCRFILSVMGHDTMWSEWDEFGPERAYGTADQLFFEDNTIHYSSTYSIPDAGWTEIGQSARVVMRYNSWDMTNAAGSGTCPEWDIHGMQNWESYPPTPGQTGTMIVEYYGNTISGGRGYRWANMRGGWGLFFNNIWTGTSAPGIEIVNLQGCDSQTGHPGQADNVYFWNNTGNRTEKKAEIRSGSTACEPNPLTENTQFYNLNDNFNGTTQHGVGRGTGVPDFSCTNLPRADANGQQVGGDAYWVASPATPTVDPAIIQAGRLYKYIGGVWTVYYTPYTYPHPLVANSYSVDQSHASALDQVRVYPNPWRSDRHAARSITFDQFTVDTELKIFTVSGHHVKTLPRSSDSVTWDLTNESGDRVASGVYVYQLKAEGGAKKTGQVVVIK